MKSLFKSWTRKKDSKGTSKHFTATGVDSQSSIVVEGSQWSSVSPTPSKSSTSSTSTPHLIQVPLLRLEPSASSSKDTFASSIEDALRYHKTPDRLSPEYQSHHHSASPHRYHDARTPISPAFAGRNGSPANIGHGPPWNAKHGPPNVLQTQLSSIKSKSDLGQRLSHQSSAYFTPGPDTKARTIKFDSSVETIPLRVSRLSLSDSKRPSELQVSRELSRVPPIPPLPPRAGSKRDETPDDCRYPRDGEKSSNSTDRPTAPEGLKLYHSSQSSPHLPERNDRSRIAQDDISSLFPSPPPLIIRKKVPQPLVLQPRTPPHPPTETIAWPPSPNPSSTDSTPVSTPTSSRHFSSTHTPTQTLLLKASFSRHGNGIPPLLYDPPTSPLPSPPVSPQPKTITPRQPTTSMKGRSHLRGAMSTSNLRHHGYPIGPPTHRMTSSDPITDAMQQSTMDKRIAHLKPSDAPRGSEGLGNRSDSSQDPPVEWGYAL